ncbi:MAG TPA: DUF6092 family protein [Jatrophihabitans sp.]|jgi:hypothetical protein
MPEDHDQELFHAITHFVCSAPVSLEESRVLGAMRLVDGAHRLMLLADGHDVFRDDPFLVEARADYEAHVDLGMSDPAAFKNWLDSFVARFVAEELRRARAAGTTSG